MLATSDLTGIYRIFLRRFGPQHWWPGDTPFEVMVGAILTQNTNWRNVEKAIRNLKAAGTLDPRRINAVTTVRLTRLIRPAGFFNQKAKYLKEYCRYYVSAYGADVKRMRAVRTKRLRGELLVLKGIGPETADSMLLYALDKPVFVIDAYTKRIFSRHGMLNEKASYGTWQGHFVSKLPRSVKVYNEFHALIVRLAKEHCTKKPNCVECPMLNVKCRKRTTGHSTLPIRLYNSEKYAHHRST